MTKTTQSNTEAKASPPITLDVLSKSLMQHTTAQIEINNQLQASIAVMEMNTQLKFESIEEKIDSNFIKLCELIDDNRRRKKGQQTDDDGFQTKDHQVHDSNSEPGRSSRSDENGDGNRIVGSKEKMLKRVELPIFDGEDAYGWIALAERFFRIGGFSETSKLEIVSVSLVGDVLSWFNSETHRRPFERWKDFKDHLCLLLAIEFDLALF